jgi:predicted nuclease with TOPRIM domain
MENTTKYKFIVALLIVVLLVLGQKFKDQRAKNLDLQDRNKHLNYRIYDYQNALQEANDNIEQANSNIEEARDYAWSSYYEMGDVLDNLETVDTVSEP